MFDVAFTTDAPMDAQFSTTEDMGADFENVQPVSTVDRATIARILGKQVVAPAAVTKRVADGTRLMNPLWAEWMMAIPGYYYDAEANRLRVYAIFATTEAVCASFKTYRMTVKNSGAAPVELTLETAPSVAEVTAEAVYKYRMNGTVDTNPYTLDARFCRVMYDANDREIGRIYSAQYRYSVVDGVASRTLTPTAKQSGNYIIDIGLEPAETTVGMTFNIVKDHPHALLPLVHTNQDAKYLWIIPDELFTNAPNGLSVTVVAGDGVTFYGPTFDKEPE